MRVLLLDAQRLASRQAIEQRLSNAKGWMVLAADDEPGGFLASQLAELQDPFCVILRGTDRIGEGFAAFIEAWLSHTSPVSPGLALRTAADSEPIPVVWRVSAIRQAGLTPPSALPWRSLILTELYGRLGGKLTWDIRSAGQLFSIGRPAGGSESRALARIGAMLSAAPLPARSSAPPRISIVLCAYNDAPYLPLALRSVVVQDVTDWQLILVDDGSEDETTRLLEGYRDDPRIQIIRHESNRGKSAALNTALSVVAAPWVLELDADDWLDPGALTSLLRHAKAASEETALIYGAYEEWRETRSGGLRYAGRRSHAPHRRQLLGTGYPVAPRLYRTALVREVGGWPVDDPHGGRLYEDFRMLLLLGRRYRLLDCGECCYHRRWRRTGISARHREQFVAWADWLAERERLGCRQAEVRGVIE
ncbi:hypothetical protein PA598K_00387 [Paenibacillus sp. 598K]|uniref:glycosyltransferase family 2 protein n=1 Tax=Paenibacillus sp. 598K TaxID=1117987 RepID=UPI000FF91E01|nr:glycosyltransferase family 2 protein [Paenibacillus sp. 598K]GBF72150.1 hypothetical protein PA598K_00387 [Paenibacillus sp. 598K]